MGHPRCGFFFWPSGQSTWFPYGVTSLCFAVLFGMYIVYYTVDSISIDIFSNYTVGSI